MTGRENFGFAVEVSLGHAVHLRGLKKAVSADLDVSPYYLPLDHGLRKDSRLPVWRNQSLRGSWGARRAVRRLSKTVRLDALYVHTQTCALLLGDVMRSVPTVVSLDATPANYDTVGAGYSHRVQGPRAESVKHRVNQHAFMRAAGVIAFSTWAAESVIRDYGVPRSRVHVVRPGVDLDRFRPWPESRAVDGAIPRVLFVGADFERKGGPQLVEAMRSLNGLAELDIVTGRPVAGTPPNVRVHAGLTHASPQLFELYGRADIFALPSQADCYGLAIVEATAAGLPVVACSVGAVPELVIDGLNGILVPPNGPHRLIAALRTLVEQPDLRRRMGEAGARRARTTHTADNYGQILALMRDVSGRAPAGKGSS